MIEEYQDDTASSIPEMPDLVRRVAIPQPLMDEIEASDLHDLARDIVYWLIYRCTTTRAQYCGIHQGLLDASVGHRIRKQVVAFVRASRYIGRASNGLYRPGRQSIRYELRGVDITTDDVDQHNNEIVSGGALALVSGDVAWRSVDFGPLLGAIASGWSKLGWDLSRRNADWSLQQVDAPTLDAETIRETVESPTAAVAHVASHARYCDRPTDGIFRKDGRVYTTVTSLPEWIRKREVKFASGSEVVDISCCYLWILSAEHRVSLVRRGFDTAEVDSLMDMIERGDFYQQIAAMAGCDTSSAKREFNTFCLFGPIGFHPLWRALESISSGICQDIRWWRSQPGGATRLAHFLQRGEGALMTDGLVDWLVSGGVPAVQVHDGAIVPEGVAELAAEWLRGHSQRLYDRSCRVKVVA